MDGRGALVRRWMVAVLRCGGPAGLAIVLLPLRTIVSNANVAVAIVAAVALAGVSGHRLTSVIGAAGGALAFALLWAPPDGSLRVERGTDRLTSVVILVVGALLAELVRLRGGADRQPEDRAEEPDQSRRVRSRWRPARARRRPRAIESLRSVGRVAQEVADGDDAEFILLDVARTLVDLLELTDCRYETAPLAGTRRPTLLHGAELELQQLRWSPMQLGFPERGFDIMVAARGRTLGRFVCSPRQQHKIGEDRVLAALVLVDQAASARLIASVT